MVKRRKFALPIGLKVGDKLTRGGQEYEVVDRDGVDLSNGKVGTVYKLKSVCNVCATEFVQECGIISTPKKSCPTPECRSASALKGITAARAAMAAKREKTGLKTDPVLMPESDLAFGDTILSKNGHRMTFIGMTAPMQGDFAKAAYQAHNFRMTCSRCGTTMEQYVVLNARARIRIVCFDCEPLDSKVKASSAPEALPSVLQPPAVRPVPPVVKRAEEINAVVEKAVLAPVKPAPKISPVEAPEQPSPQFLLVCRLWHALRSKLEASHKSVNQAIGFPGHDMTEPRRKLSEQVNHPSFPAMVKAQGLALLVEIDKLLSAGV